MFGFWNPITKVADSTGVLGYTVVLLKIDPIRYFVETAHHFSTRRSQ